MNENDDEFPFSFSVICHLYGEKIKIIVIVIVIVRLVNINLTTVTVVKLKRVSITDSHSGDAIRPNALAKVAANTTLKTRTQRKSKWANEEWKVDKTRTNDVL